MAFGDTDWWARMEAIAASPGGPGTEINAGQALDVATAPWQSANPAYLKAVRDYQERQQQLAQQAQQQPSGWQRFLGNAAEVISLGDPVFKVLAAPYEWVSSEILSKVTHVGIVAANKDHQRRIGATDKWDALFDGRTWHQTDLWAERDSWGRGLLMNLKGIGGSLSGDNVVTDEKIARWQREMNDGGGQFASGSFDFAGWLLFDPLILLGKGAKAAGLFSTTRKSAPVIARSDDFDEIMAREPVRRFLEWTNGRTADQIAKHSALRNSPQAGLISSMLADAQHGDKALIYRLGLGDEQAFQQLQRESPHIAGQLQRLKGQHAYLASTFLPGQRLTGDEEAEFLAELASQRRTAALKERLLQTEFLPHSYSPHPFVPNVHVMDPGTLHGFANFYTGNFANIANSTMFTPSGGVVRTGAEAEKGLKRLAELEDSFRALSGSGVIPAKAPRPMAGLSKTERAAKARGSGYRYTKKGEPREVVFYSSDDLVSPTPLSGRAKGAKQLPIGVPHPTDPVNRAMEPLLKRGLADMASHSTVPGQLAASHQADLIRGAINRGAPNKYPLADWPAKIQGAADEIAGQTSLLDDVITPEIAHLDAEFGWIKRAEQAIDDLDITGPKTGIFNSLDVIPKGGIYAGLAERKAAKLDAKDLRFEKGWGQWRQVNWLNRPVFIATKFGDYLGKTGSPTAYSPHDLEGWKTLDSWLKTVKGLSGADRLRMVREHMGLTNEADKLAHIERVESEVIAHVLVSRGITDNQSITAIVAGTLGAKKAFIGRMADQIKDSTNAGMTRASNSGAYSATRNADGVRVDGIGSDGTAIVVAPILRNQLLNNHPLLPVRELEKAIWRDRHILRGGGVFYDNVMEVTQTAQRLWKLSVLARVGYVTRTVSDEALLAMATINALQYAAGGFKGVGASVGQIPTGARNLGVRYRRVRDKGNRVLNDEELEPRWFGRGEQPVNVGDDILARGMFQGARGAIFRGLTSTEQRALYDAFDRNLAQLRQAASYQILDPATADPNAYYTAWKHALENQIGKDDLARLALGGAGVDEMVAWLKTPAGRQYSAGNRLMAARREEWAASVHQMVDMYTVGMPEIRAAAVGGRVDLSLLQKVPEPLRPTVHGGQIDYALGNFGFTQWTNALMDGFYKFANKLPTDALVRHPVADILYQQRLRELVASARAQGVDPATSPDRLYHMEEVARQWTVKQMNIIFKDHLFDAPQTALKFMMPFFGAWRAALARWGHAVGEDPSVIARFNAGWNGLHKPFDVVDENDVLVDDDEEAFGVNTKNKIIVRLPEWAVKQIGGYAPAKAIPLKSFNTILQGDQWFNPGFGPFATIPVSEIVRGNPAAEELAQPILPFGARSVTENLLPSYAQKAMAADAGLDNRSYAQAFVNIFRVEITRYQLGQRDKPPTAAEIRKKADHLTGLRKWYAFLLPVSTQDVYYDKAWETPFTGTYQDASGKKVKVKRDLPDGWQFLASKYREYRQQFPGKTGEAKFLEEFPEAFAYLESTSRNISGIPANRASWDKSKVVKHLAATMPDIFPSVADIREWDKQGFDRSVYNAQFSTQFNPETGENFREKADPLQFYKNVQVAQGWREFEKAMNLLYAELDKRELVSFSEPGAKDLKEIKQQIVGYMKTAHPAWYQEYTNPDLERRGRIISQAQALVRDPKFSKRKDIVLLQQYLEIREAFKRVLLARKAGGGSITMTARDNVDILHAWDRVKDTFNGDTDFSELWGMRYFENDFLQEVS